MCGIAGLVDFSGNADPHRRVLSAMVARLHHRGPDGQGTVILPGPAWVGLGHTRLSIIDLSDAGCQPMTNEDQTLWVTFNGEIYNYVELREDLLARGHRFSSRTDTEVILHAYEEFGTDCVHKFNGMFAFALWDAGLQRLWLVRDRLGVKPLIYARTPWGCIFGSELGAVLAHPDVDRSLDMEAASLYFTSTFVPDPWTIYCGIRRLPPACSLSIQHDGERLEKYWDVPSPPLNGFRRPLHETEEELRHLVADAVRIRLRSDVPLGAFLSGGIDSSLVVAHMARQSARQIKTFFIGYEQHELGDESPYARAVAHRYETDHTEIILSASDMLKRVPEVLDCLDEPFADSSALPTHEISRCIRDHVVVALSGDGGDEIFGGYRRYLAEAWVGPYLRIPSVLRHRVLDKLTRALPDSKGSWFGEVARRAKIFVNGYDRDPLFRHAAWQGKISSSQEPIFGPGLAAAGNPAPWIQLIRRIGSGSARDPVNRALYIDLRNSLPGDMLTKVDLMSMRHALEVRSPLLDYRVAEFAFRLPGKLKVGVKHLKRILKSSHAPLLPPQLQTRPKYGFEVPIGEWLKRDQGFTKLFWDVVTDPRIRQARFFDEDRLASAYAEHTRNRHDHTHRLWAVLVFSWWYGRHTPTH